jgi:hypothetical protein
MGKRPFTRKDIVDLIITRANERFTGDKRDGNPRPITVQNFHDESYRRGTRALRARLSRPSLAELANEGVAALDHDEAKREQLQQIVALAERNEHEQKVQRQAELARRPRLQPAILAAARYYRSCQIRGRKMYAGEAWRAIQKEPYQTSNGEIVTIEGDELRVQSRTRTQRRSPIKFGQWQKTLLGRG